MGWRGFLQNSILLRAARNGFLGAKAERHHEAGHGLDMGHAWRSHGAGTSSGQKTPRSDPGGLIQACGTVFGAGDCLPGETWSQCPQPSQDVTKLGGPSPAACSPVCSLLSLSPGLDSHMDKYFRVRSGSLVWQAPWPPCASGFSSFPVHLKACGENLINGL